jgi:hypothetical protein
MPTNSVDLLCAMLAVRTLVVRGAAFAPRAALAPLLASGTLVAAGHVESILCSDCGAQHDVRPTQERLGWLCEDAGFVPAEPDEVAAFEVRRERIAARISDHLSKGRVTTWPSEHPILWSLGSFNFRQFGIAVHFAPNIGNLETFDAVNDYLQLRQPRMDGIAVLTNDQRNLGGLKLGSRIVRLADVFDIRLDGRTTVDLVAIAKWALPADKLRSPTRGRPAAQRDRLMPIIERLHATVDWARLSERGQVRRIKTEYLAAHGRDATVSDSTVKDALKRSKPGLDRS